MEYHNNLFDDFVEKKDYEKLAEYVILCDIIPIFRTHLKSPRSQDIIEQYVSEIKRFAENLYDLSEKYGYDTVSEYSIINDYTDVIFAL